MITAEEIARLAQTSDTCPEELDPVAQTLWLAKAGQWHAAHDQCQDLPDPAGAWIHAWLHRQEGDYGNACYWYDRAGKPVVAEKASLADEWLEIAKALVG